MRHQISPSLQDAVDRAVYRTLKSLRNLILNVLQSYHRTQGGIFGSFSLKVMVTFLFYSLLAKFKVLSCNNGKRVQRKNGQNTLIKFQFT